MENFDELDLLSIVQGSNYGIKYLANIWPLKTR